MNNKALGLIETIGLVPAIEAADVAVKTANVELTGCLYTGAGLVTVVMRGDVSSVKASVEAGKSAAKRIGEVRSVSVIARTADGLEKLLGQKGEGCKEKKKLSLKPDEQLLKKEETVAEKSLKSRIKESRGSDITTSSTSDIKQSCGSDAEETGGIGTEESGLGDIKKSGQDAIEAASPPSCDLNMLKSMNVSKLRSLARRLDNFSLSLEKINFARKRELIEAILQYYSKYSG